MELKDILQQMMRQTMSASQPTDLQVGTVTSASPLEITISPTMAPLRAGVLYLTSAVVEKKITALSHSHREPFPHAHHVRPVSYAHVREHGDIRKPDRLIWLFPGVDRELQKRHSAGQGGVLRKRDGAPI